MTDYILQCKETCRCHGSLGWFTDSSQVHWPSPLKTFIKNIILSINIYKYLAWKDST